MKKEKIKPSTQINESTIHFLPLLPLKNVAMLPKSIIPVIVGRDISTTSDPAGLRSSV